MGNCYEPCNFWSNRCLIGVREEVFMDWFCGLEADPFLADVYTLRRFGDIHRRMQAAVPAGN
eukprot:12765343-Prorocentrum_lima.AAC.1